MPNLPIGSCQSRSCRRALTHRHIRERTNKVSLTGPLNRNAKPPEPKSQISEPARHTISEELLFLTKGFLRHYLLEFLTLFFVPVEHDASSGFHSHIIVDTRRSKDISFSSNFCSGTDFGVRSDEEKRTFFICPAKVRQDERAKGNFGKEQFPADICCHTSEQCSCSRLVSALLHCSPQSHRDFTLAQHISRAYPPRSSS